MPKVDRYGHAEVLSQGQLEELFQEATYPHKLIFQIAYFTAARIGEVCSLKAESIVNEHIVYLAVDTKTDETRTVRIAPRLRKALNEAELPARGYLFPGKGRSGHITPRAVDKALRELCGYLGFHGVSTHSFRRSALTHLHKAGKPLRTVQGISGHRSLANLERYLDLRQQEADDALLDVFG